MGYISTPHQKWRITFDVWSYEEGQVSEGHGGVQMAEETADTPAY
jgi:hypothetical protein